MEQYQETFKRYEKKYLVGEKKYKILIAKLQDRLCIDRYGKITVSNIYFDTPNYLLIRNSLGKPVYKEKLRLRSYKTPSIGDDVFIELKKKYKGIVYKRREKLELSMAEDYLYRHKPLARTSQILREIDWFLMFYQNVIPSMFISYQRVAMYGFDNPFLRVTFDSNILWRKEELDIKKGVWGNPLLYEGQRLMEIKTPESMPLWLSRLLSEMEIYPVSFSKYGKAYMESGNFQYKNIIGGIKYA